MDAHSQKKSRSRKSGSRQDKSVKESEVVAEGDQGVQDESVYEEPQVQGSQSQKKSKRSEKSRSAKKPHDAISGKAKSKSTVYKQKLTQHKEQSTHNSMEHAGQEDIGIDFGVQEKDEAKELDELNKEIEKRNTLDAQEHEAMMELQPPVQLISIENDKNGKEQFTINIEALNMLKNVDTPLAVFSMCGGTKLGKSSLLNRLFNFFKEDSDDSDREHGFKVAKQVEKRSLAASKKIQKQDGTEGVWMLQPMFVNSRGINIVVLDFQGFNFNRYAGDKSAMSGKPSNNNSNLTDSKLFALCSLLSSAICFNIQKTFDEKTLEDLHFIKDLNRRIQIKPSVSAAKLMNEHRPSGGRGNKEDPTYLDHLLPQLMPKMMWLVRDQKLKFTDKQGNEMLENQYLELTLSQIAKSSSRAILKTRDKIVQQFPDRELIAMGHPDLNGEDDGGDYEGLEDKYLNPAFLNDVHWIRDKMLSDTPVKQIWTRKITGPTLAFLCSEFVRELNEKGSIIKFSDSWEFFLEVKLEEVYEQAVKHVEKTIRNHMWGGDANDEQSETPEDDGASGKVIHEKLPLQQQDVMFIFDKLRTDVMGRFDEILSLVNTQEEKANVLRKMEEVEQDIQSRLRPFDQKNTAEAQKTLVELDAKMFKNIRKGLKQNKSSIKTFSLGKEFEEYLTTMAQDEEWEKITDSEQVAFLLSQLPKNIEHINSTLTEVLFNQQDVNMIVEDVLKTKKAIQEQINEEKEKRQEIHDAINDIEHQTDKVEDKVEALLRQSDALKLKLEVLTAENQALEEELDLAKIKQKAQHDYREQIKDQENVKANKSRNIEEEKSRYSQKSRRTGHGGADGDEDKINTAGGPIETEVNLDPKFQKIPKVTRTLPHIRQPTRRDRDIKGVFRSYVERQYIPRFFTFI